MTFIKKKQVKVDGLYAPPLRCFYSLVNQKNILSIWILKAIDANLRASARCTFVYQKNLAIASGVARILLRCGTCSSLFIQLL
jgi:hypothetical protein